VFRKPSELPIALAVDEPDAVGIDRVFGAIAARSMTPPDTPAITVDVGTAVTVNRIDAAGVFRGGAIFPGPTLMARALHEHTAKLPLIELTTPVSTPTPGRNTRDAIRTGIQVVVREGVAGLVMHFADVSPAPPSVYLTGGGADIFRGFPVAWCHEPTFVPFLNLEGVRIAAEALP
jgi:type III pantothenate kinase